MRSDPKKNEVINFPNISSINIELGLKHCNKNRALYFKVLNNFVSECEENGGPGLKRKYHLSF